MAPWILVNIGSGNALSSDRCQAIACANNDLWEAGRGFSVRYDDLL